MVSKKAVKKKKEKDRVILLKLKRKILDNKNKLILLILLIIDVGLIIYVASDNAVNYVNVNGEEIFVGQTKNVLFGRNYVTLVISAFIYLYGLLLNKMILQKKISKKLLLFILIGILLFNMILFCIFTNKVY